jgi:hypothetical protein
MATKNRNHKKNALSQRNASMSARQIVIPRSEIILARRNGISQEELLIARQNGISQEELLIARRNNISLSKLVVAKRRGISLRRLLVVRQRDISRLYNGDVSSLVVRNTGEDNIITYKLKKCSSRESIENFFTQFKINDKVKRIAKLNDIMGNPQTFFFSDGEITVDDKYELTIQMFLTGSWKLTKYYERLNNEFYGRI